MKTGFTCSTFDLLHAGHVLMLMEAKNNCDYLIVGLQTDPTIDRPDTKNKPVQSIVERQLQLQAVKYIDEIIVYETEQDLMDILQTADIDIRFIGEDYIGKDFTGKQYCIDAGIDIEYNSRKHRFSTTELRQRAGLSKTDI
jgi:glycerol-3-phosphate cytidylyltransferase